MSGWKPYIVQQGEHLRKLAFQLGVDADEVWSHPKNSDLADKRESMNRLCPGDVVYVPDEPPETLQVQAGTANRYKARIPTVAVKLKLELEPSVAGAAFEVRTAHLDDRPLTGVAGPDGEVAFDVPVETRELEIHFPDRHVIVPMRVGDLDPISEESGVVQRLRNLGYLAGGGEVAADTLSAALGAFQADYGMNVTGNADSDTLAALVAIYGS